MLDYREFYGNEEYIDDDDDSDAIYLAKLEECEKDGEQEEEREYIPSYPVDERSSSSSYKTRKEICQPYMSEFRSDD